MNCYSKHRFAEYPPDIRQQYIGIYYIGIYYMELNVDIHLSMAKKNYKGQVLWQGSIRGKAKDCQLLG